jgi:hypothetical protein
MPWAIMDQAVGLPTLNACFIDGTFFVANHPMENSYMTVTPPWKRFCGSSPSMVRAPCLQSFITVVLPDSGIIFPSKSLAAMVMLAPSIGCCTGHICELDGIQRTVPRELEIFDKNKLAHYRVFFMLIFLFLLSAMFRYLGNCQFISN